MSPRRVVSEVAFRPARRRTESNRIRSLYLRLRQARERSCVRPSAYLWSFGLEAAGESKTRLRLGGLRGRPAPAAAGGRHPGSHLAAPPGAPRPAARPAPARGLGAEGAQRASRARPPPLPAQPGLHRIEACGSAADSAKEPGAASATRGDLTCRISVRGSGFRSTSADLFLKLSSPEAESAVNNL